MVRQTDFPLGGSLEEQARYLVRYAQLAPSSHNTQPWLFQIDGGRVTVRADDRRWLRVADPDQLELLLSAGCALENLLVAAEHFGLGTECRYLPDPSDVLAVAAVELSPAGEPSPHRPGELFDAIPYRHTNHLPYEPREVPTRLLVELRSLCFESDVESRFSTSSEVRDRVDELVERGDAVLFSDPRYRRELADWIGKGAFGTPWILSKVGKLAMRHVNPGRTLGRRDRDLVASAPVLGLLSSHLRSSEVEIKAGQIYERMSLAAAAEGIWFQPMSQVLQVPELRSELAELFAERTGARPLMLFRLGYARPERRTTPRRDLDDVLSA